MASHFSTEASALHTFVASLSQTRIMHAGHKLSHHCVPNVQVTGIPEWGRDCCAALSPVEPSRGVQRLRIALPYHLTPLTHRLTQGVQVTSGVWVCLMRDHTESYELEEVLAQRSIQYLWKIDFCI